MKLRATLASYALLLFAATVQAALPLWRAELDGRSVWLLGSVHVAQASIYPLAPPIEAAYRNADTLVVEMDAGNMAATEPLLASTLLAPGEHFETLLSPPVAAALREQLVKSGLELKTAEQLKPWMATLTLIAMQMEKDGFKARNGVDLHFLKRMAADGKKLVELESMKFQFDLFNNLSPEENEVFVADTLNQLKTGKFKKELRAMMLAWQQGDVKRLQQALDEANPQGPAGASLVKKLIADRNGPMADKIADLAAGSHPPLVVIGAGHLIGPGSVVELLTKRGFRVQQQ